MPDTKKMIEYKKIYLLNALGGSKGLARKFWAFRIRLMSEGEILRRYYELTQRKTEGENIRDWGPSYEGRN